MKFYAIKNSKGQYWSYIAYEWRERVSETQLNEVLTSIKTIAEAHLSDLEDELDPRIVEFSDALQPVKEVVTQKEAEIIEYAKISKHALGSLYLDSIDDPSLMDDERLMRAYLNGYEVKKEKRYYVWVDVPGDVRLLGLQYFKTPNDTFKLNVKEVDTQISHLEEYRFTMGEIEWFNLQDCKRAEVEEYEA